MTSMQTDLCVRVLVMIRLKEKRRRVMFRVRNVMLLIKLQKGWPTEN